MATFFTIDFGVNFGTKKYTSEKIDQLIKTSWNDGVDKIVSISNSLKESKTNILLGEKYENIYFTIGCHPHNAKNFIPNDIKFLRENVNNKKCFGIGECGLDYNRMFSSKPEQIYAFENQVILAKELETRLYLHCRDAYEDFVGILRKIGYYNGLIHCFTGNIDQALELTSLGFKLGITGWLLDHRRNLDLQKVVSDKRIKLTSFIVETDAPYMPIFPKKESEPSDTAIIIQEIARLRKIDWIECGKELYVISKDFLIKKKISLEI
jgi:TatD DNase family protein